MADEKNNYPEPSGNSPVVMTEEAYKEKVIKDFLSIWKWGDPAFYELIIEACKLHERKNRGYAGKRDPLANFYECEGFGVPAWKGCLVRMSDKWSRMKTLVTEENDPVLIEAKKMESIEDTIFDLGVYSFIELILLKKAKAKKLYREILVKDKEISSEECMGQVPSSSP